jgi:hypothetical protein
MKWFTRQEPTSNDLVIVLTKPLSPFHINKEACPPLVAIATRIVTCLTGVIKTQKHGQSIVPISLTVDIDPSSFQAPAFASLDYF